MPDIQAIYCKAMNGIRGYWLGVDLNLKYSAYRGNYPTYTANQIYISFHLPNKRNFFEAQSTVEPHFQANLHPHLTTRHPHTERCEWDGSAFLQSYFGE